VFQLDFQPLALLRIAFLLLFKNLGNAFFLTQSAQKIASLINNPEAAGEPYPFLIKGPLEKISEGIYIIFEPTELSSYLIVFNLKTKGYSEKYGVIIPGAHDDDIKVFHQWKILSQSAPIKITFFELPDSDYLTDESYCMTPYLSWFK
jgi:hypothetical protein